MSLSSGTVLGPYEIVALLGAGGMGEVYRARDTRLDRTVALKVVSAALGSDPALRARFEREARAISSLTHPNICALYDVGHQDGIDYLVMEYLEGELPRTSSRADPFPRRRCCGTARTSRRRCITRIAAASRIAISSRAM